MDSHKYPHATPANLKLSLLDDTSAASKQSPVNRLPLLPCDKCCTWTLHCFQFKTPYKIIESDGRETTRNYRDLIFACFYCNTERVFGREA